MNRKEFIDKLDYLLQDIEDIEREEALQYYEDYFDCDRHFYSCLDWYCSYLCPEA